MRFLPKRPFSARVNATLIHILVIALALAIAILPAAAQTTDAEKKDDKDKGAAKTEQPKTNELNKGSEPAGSPSSGGSSSGCKELSITDDFFCNGEEKIENSLKVPQDMTSWYNEYSSSSDNSKSQLASNIKDFAAMNELLKFVVQKGIDYWSEKNFGCQLAEVRFAWFKSVVCTHFLKDAAEKCGAPKTLPLCPMEKDEFYQSLKIAIDAPENKCPEDANDKLKALRSDFDKAVKEVSKPKCRSGRAIETNRLCGYPNDTEACRHRCDNGEKSKTKLSERCAKLIDKKTVYDAAFSTLYTTPPKQSWSNIFSLRVILFIVGGVVVVIILLVVLFLVLMKRKSRHSRSSHEFGDLKGSKGSDSRAFDSVVDGYNLPYRVSSTAPRISIAQGNNELHMVVMDYEARMSDEISIYRGDKIRVIEIYEDQYALGEKMSGESGIFPMMCLEGYEASGNTLSRPLNSQDARQTTVNASVGRFTVFSMMSDNTRMSPR